MSKLTLPGLIDPHVHLRDPGQTNKEDFFTGTGSALAGGFTTILDMPNNKLPITTMRRLEEKIKIAKEKIVCDVGFYFGSMGDNINELIRIKDKVLGLKLYLSLTTGGFVIPKEKVEQVFIAWNQGRKTKDQRPILLHAEDDTLDFAINLSKKLGSKIHICHISTMSDLKQIIKAKKNNLLITCGVTPHHLFLTQDDVKELGPFGKMKPSLATKKDQEFLWKNLEFIDLIESDHAPHTLEEKRGEVTPFGVPGLETTLPLLLTAASQNRLEISDIVRLCHTNPAKIFNIRTNSSTRIQIDLNSSFIINNLSLFTKCGWSPFDGWEAKGKIEKVWIRTEKVFENGKILAKPGFGKVLTDNHIKR
ncbi:MAG: amidohydrolase family protein [Candidatus Levybacteria bacterium]|nr:amidohydrolase family protein [Candidatus Levybacteria bacterium]